MRLNYKYNRSRGNVIQIRFDLPDVRSLRVSAIPLVVVAMAGLAAMVTTEGVCGQAEPAAPDSDTATLSDSLHKRHTVDATIQRALSEGMTPNRLIDEKSPYLLQHAFNPVDWYPWGDEAFDAAREQDKPIFLSIGYSTCHWCHVMEHESFENDSVAAILNANFVSIKVDREERPDVDTIYMMATQAMTGGGGWPMSVFLTHDLKPFYAGTYFPPEPKFGKPGFIDVLTAIHEGWENERDNILNLADRITNSLQQQISQASFSEILPGNLDSTTFARIASNYDAQYGGFGRAPKFPRPVTPSYLLRYYHFNGDKSALGMATSTLSAMAAGGMYDQIGGGFHRYSTDRTWHVPHFEKMLYDQAQLASVYVDAFQVTGNERFADVTREVLDYVLRDMTAPEGGFYSAEDADSPLPDNPAEQAEGAYYVWTSAEIDEVLDPESARVFKARYGVTAGGNVKNDPQGEFAGKNILFLAESNSGFDLDRVDDVLLQARSRLFRERSTRPRPQMDDKVVTSWNGLMISALAKAYQVLREDRYLAAAEKAASFIQTTLYQQEERTLVRRYRDGEAGLPAHLDDYAFLVYGLLDLYESTGDAGWLRWAIDLTERQLQLFLDPDFGGFFDAAQNDKHVLRTKSWTDMAEPSGNSIAALNLLRLTEMTDNDDWRQRGMGTINAFSTQLSGNPSAAPQMMAAFDFANNTTKQIVIAGNLDASDTKRMLEEAHRHFLPNRVLLMADGAGGQQFLEERLEFIRSVHPRDGEATAFVCEHYVCKLPTTDLAVFSRLLEE
ncbi:MAG: thioredoxin domain-containing protein [Rhodothermia bacterium]